MKKVMILKKMNSQNGGIGTIIAVLVMTILVLGLISSAILSQVAGAKDTGNKAEIEQQKISRMLQDPDVVTGSTVRNYISQATASESEFTVSVASYSGNTLDAAVTYSSGTATAVAIKDNALYKMKKSYNANGELSSISFVQANLSKSN